MPVDRDLRTPWKTELAFRARWRFPLKFVATSALIAVFFAGYFYVQGAPSDAPTIMPLTALDRIIPFQPYALLAYLSLWVYVGAGPGLQRTNSELLRYALWMGALCGTGLGVFYLWPTQMPVTIFEESGSHLFQMLRRVDSTGNACPSMHVAAAVFTVIRVHDVLARAHAPRWLKWLNVVWCLLIVYSTMAVKQHVALDVVGGALLGALFGWSSLVSMQPATSGTGAVTPVR